jgi:regulation of enolase protein 1 (concanavalin A-like superfamily)
MATRLPGFTTKRLSITTGQKGIYLRLEKSNWNKCFAFIIGCNNIGDAVQETVYGFYNSDEQKIVAKTKGSITWTVDQSGSSVGTTLSVGSELLVFYYGFTVVGAY